VHITHVHATPQDMFANPMYKPVWFKAFGLACYTRLVRRRAALQGSAKGARLRLRVGRCGGTRVGERASVG
jgi:hypothetical protein